MRTDDVGFVGYVEVGERSRGVLQRFPIRRAAHDDGDARHARRLAFLFRQTRKLKRLIELFRPDVFRSQDIVPRFRNGRMRKKLKAEATF